MISMRSVRGGCTKSYIAKILGISVQQYSNYESGAVKIPALVFIHFCKHYRVNPLRVEVPVYVGGGKNA